ncbi:MAG: HEAT repeat domain-containing protein [Gemmatimonadales bacterium]
MTPIIGITLILFAFPASLAAQTLAQRVQAAGEGRVRLSFAAREGVCGDGRSNITIIDHDDGDEWEGECNPGPVRVSLRLSDGRVSDANTYVGGRWRRSDAGITDLGLVPAGEAADYLLSLAPRAGEAGEELITAATLADSAAIWPTLLRFARDPNLRMDTRRHAVFWLGQAAGEAATRGLDSIAMDARGDLEVRKHAVFALAQRPSEEGVPALSRIARTNTNPELRNSALFRLGQSEDPRALALFEELLR